MPFIVMTASAKMPSSVKSQYRKVAIVEIYEGAPMPHAIDIRSKSIKRIVRIWDKLHVGKTASSAYHKALAEAEALRNELNAGE